MTKLHALAALALSSFGCAAASRDGVFAPTNPFPDGRPRVRYPQIRAQVDHYEQPKPLTKRQKRRARKDQSR